jgi:phosphoribosylcarboxyaminoimidazole (NCAIR) mutase
MSSSHTRPIRGSRRGREARRRGARIVLGALGVAAALAIAIAATTGSAPRRARAPDSRADSGMKAAAQVGRAADAGIQ